MLSELRKLIAELIKQEVEESSGTGNVAGYSTPNAFSDDEKDEDELNLSDAQLGRFIRLHQKNSQEHKQSKKKIHQGMKSLHHAGMKPSTDDATLRKLGNEHVEAFNAMLEQHIKNRNVVNAILTAEQREQLKTMKMNHGKHGGHHGGHKEKHSSKYY